MKKSQTYGDLMRNAFAIVRDFEQAVAEYTGAPYAVAVDCCTNAIFLTCKYLNIKKVCIPKNTYVSVPNQILHAGGQVEFEDLEWSGSYQLKPYPIYDCAKRFTSNMYVPKTFQCLSFQAKKILNIGKGGMILTDNLDAVEWFKKARYNGRSEKPLEEDYFDSLGWNMYMTPEQAATGLWKMLYIALDNPDQPCDNAIDLSKYEIFSKLNIAE